MVGHQETNHDSRQNDSGSQGLLYNTLLTIINDMVARELTPDGQPSWGSTSKCLQSLGTHGRHRKSLKITPGQEFCGLLCGLRITQCFFARRNRHRGHCYRRERAAAYGKLLKLRDTNGFQKQFQ